MLHENGALALVPQDVVIIGELAFFDDDERGVDAVLLQRIDADFAAIIRAHVDTQARLEPQAGAGDCGIRAVADARDEHIEFKGDFVAEAERNKAVLMIEVAGGARILDADEIVDHRIPNRQNIHAQNSSTENLAFSPVYCSISRMVAVQLEVKPRGAEETAETLRSSGRIPAVFYGPKQEATPISIDGRKLESVWRDAGETTLISLTGAGDNQDTLIHDVQVHPITGKIMHADFYVIEKGKKVEVNVPLEFVGEAPAEKQGLVLSKVIHELPIEVSPAELPHTLDVDLTKLENVGDHILAKDIALPKSAELKIGADEIIVSVSEPAKEEEAPAAPAAEGEAEAAPAPEGEAAPAEEAKAE